MSRVYYAILKQEVIAFLNSINKKHRASTGQDAHLSGEKDQEISHLISSVIKFKPEADEPVVIEPVAIESEAQEPVAVKPEAAKPYTFTDAMALTFNLLSILKQSRDITTRAASTKNKNEGSTEPSIDNVRIFCLDFLDCCAKLNLFDLKMEDVCASKPENVFKYFCALYMATHFRQRLEARLGIITADYFPELNQQKEDIFLRNLQSCMTSINELTPELRVREDKKREKVFKAVDDASTALAQACDNAKVGAKIPIFSFTVFNTSVDPSYTPNPGFMKVCLIATQIMIEHDLEIDKALKIAKIMKKDEISYSDASKSMREDASALTYHH